MDRRKRIWLKVPLLAFLLAFLLTSADAQPEMEVRSFQWPEGKKAAVSLSFDDGRSSQVEGGTALLDKYGVKATFYVVPGAVKSRLEEWRKAVASGHEIGNHSLNHPCTGNFEWSRSKALEDYDLNKMRTELAEANRQIEELLYVSPAVFAYPCGQTFVGRGTATRSYVPVVAELFQSGRRWFDETANDPSFCDPAQLTGVEMDGKDFEEIRVLLETARQQGQWLVLAGHEMDESGPQTTRLAMLEKLIQYAADPANGIWLAPVGEVGAYVKAQRK